MRSSFSTLFVAFVAGSFKLYTGLLWTSAPYQLLVCEGDDLALTWNFTLQSGEEVTGVQWHLHRPGESDQLLAVYVAGRYLRAPMFTSHLEFLPLAGLGLISVTRPMLGTYSVQLNYTHQGRLLESVQRAQISLPEPPVTKGRELVARILPLAELDESTGDWHVQIACGDFVDAGRPPVSVTWTTPTRKHVTSTSYSSEGAGRFVLKLPNTVAEGDYSCRLEVAQSSKRCIRVPSPLWSPATVHVDVRKVRLAVVVARLQVLDEENKLLRKGELPTPRCPVPVQGPQSCVEMSDYFPASGVHDLFLRHNRIMSVYCNQTVGDGGWTVIQRRLNGALSFNKNWDAYEKGFGDFESEFWFGLINIYHLTSTYDYSLRVDLTDWDGNTGYALYDTFYIDGASDNYRLHVAGYSGTIGDGLNMGGGGQVNEMQFSSPDKDHDRSRSNCARTQDSGWWYNQCFDANQTSVTNLNGVYGRSVTAGSGMTWSPWHHDGRTYMHAEMKIRPRKT